MHGYEQVRYEMSEVQAHFHRQHPTASRFDVRIAHERPRGREVLTRDGFFRILFWVGLGALCFSLWGLFGCRGEVVCHW